MSSKRTSRKRRKRQRASSGAAQRPAPASRTAATPTGADAPSAPLAEGASASTAERASAPPSGYARARAKDDEARAKLKPLRRGERPTAVTVGAIVAAALAVANVVALAFGYNASEDTVSPGSEFSASVLTTLVVAIVAYGMWRARYWGVLGMQTLLALTLVVASLALLFANSIWAALLLVIIIAGSGTLFWFLIKAMARIQMPERPGAQRRTS
jgi:cation transport ATPase